MTDLYADSFQVIGKTDGQFDNISRIELQSENSKIVIDINTYIYPIKENGRYSIVFKNELSTEPMDKAAHWHPSYLKNSDNVTGFEYIMCGKVYHYEEKAEAHRATIYISFGGLLMRLEGELRILSQIHKAPNNVYFLMREVK